MTDVKGQVGAGLRDLPVHHEVGAPVEVPEDHLVERILTDNPGRAFAVAWR